MSKPTDEYTIALSKIDDLSPFVELATELKEMADQGRINDMRRKLVIFYSACHPEPVVDGGDDIQTILEKMISSAYWDGRNDYATKWAKQALLAREQRLVREADTKARLDELSYVSPATARFENGKLIGSVGGRIKALAQLLPKHSEEGNTL